MRKFIWIIMMGLILSVPAITSAAELELFIYSSNQKEDLDPNKIVREYVFNQMCYNTFMVKGFTRNPDGLIDLTAHIKLIDPSGIILFKLDNFAHLKVTPPQDVEYVNFDSLLEVIIEDVDPVGMYTVELEVADNISSQKETTDTTLLYFDTKESKELIMKPVETAKDLDNLWAEYFRSKNPWAVKRIISALRLRKESPYLEVAVVGAAAKWSLEVNAKERSDVLAICKESLTESKGTIHELLQEIIANVEKKKGSLRFF